MLSCVKVACCLLHSDLDGSNVSARSWSGRQIAKFSLPAGSLNRKASLCSGRHHHANCRWWSAGSGTSCYYSDPGHEVVLGIGSLKPMDIVCGVLTLPGCLWVQRFHLWCLTAEGFSFYGFLTYLSPTFSCASISTWHMLMWNRNTYRNIKSSANVYGIKTLCDTVQREECRFVNQHHCLTPSEEHKYIITVLKMLLYNSHHRLIEVSSKCCYSDNLYKSFIKLTMMNQTRVHVQHCSSLQLGGHAVLAMYM